MTRPVVLSFLWPKNSGVLIELARKGNFDIAAPPSVVPERFASTLAEIDRRYIPVIDNNFATHAAAAQGEAGGRFERLAPALSELIGRQRDLGATTQEAIEEQLRRLLPAKIRNAIAVIDELDLLLSNERIAAVLVNETDTVSGRLLALWARERGIPSFLMSHGSNIGNAYSVTRCMHADYLFVFGPRGTETYLDIGVPASRMAITGNPAWDRYPSVLAARAQYRKDAYERFSLRPNEPLVLFATVWYSKLTPLSEPDIFEKTVRAFIQACKRLREAGRKFNVIFKDRPANAEFGKGEIGRIAAEEGFSDFAYGVGDLEAYIVAADLLVSCNSNSFVEAMAAGVPAINFWTPSTWFLGPGFDAADGIPMVPVDDVPQLTAVMEAALNDDAFRAKLLDRMAKRLPHYHVAMDGGSTGRVVDAIITLLAANAQIPSPTPIVSPQSSDEAAAVLRLLDRVPQSVAILGRAGARLAADLQIQHPAAKVHVVEQPSSGENLLGVGIASQSIDLLILSNVLEENYDPAALLSQVRRFLKAGAKVLAVVPNVRNLWLIRELLCGRWNYQADELLDPRRLRFFTLNTIMEVFASAGYRVDRVHPQRDPRVARLPDPSGGTVNVEIDIGVLKNMNAEDVAELSTRDFLIGATLQ